jgi:4-amino-4-deoxy-L-arabinose transferase-like glycosyltransferase
LASDGQGDVLSGPAGRVLAWLLLVAALGWGLGSYPLLDPDEGRNSEVAREMAASGDFGLPRLDGLPYLDKPVAFFAVDALAQRLFGAEEAAARLPSLLFALATAALTGWFAGRAIGRRARWIAALAALAAPLPIAFARTVIFDSMLAFFLVLALCAFWLAVEARAMARAATGSPYLPWTLLAWAAIGAGILTKGPVALAVPLLAAVPYAIYRRASRAVWHPLGLVVAALLVSPWLWWVSRQVPEFLHYALVTETWERIATPAMNREGPIWLYVPCLLAGTLPWSLLVIAGWRRSLRLRDAAHRIDPVRLYLVLWIAVPFVMFSLSHSKRAQYILPLLPAVALLAAKVWVDAEGANDANDVQDPGVQGTGVNDNGINGSDPNDEAAAHVALGANHGGASDPQGASRGLPGRRAAAVTWLILGAACAAAAPFVARSHSRALAHVTRLPGTLLALAAGFLAGAALLHLAGRRPAVSASSQPGRSTAGAGLAPFAGRRALLVLGLVLPIAALPALSLPLLGEIGSHRSSRGAAAAILPLLGPGARVVGIHAFPPSLPFYLRRTMLVASPHGRELTSNYVIAYFQKWLAAAPAETPLRPQDWWRGAVAACNQPLVFVTWTDDAASRTTLSSLGLPLLAANDRMAAYGPCTPPKTPGRP